MTLLQRIRTQILEHGAMPFSEFMQQALYDPEFGYYTSGLQKLGKGGDFVTAPELTPLFGYALAHQCQQILSTLTNPIVFEFGAGTGQLCVDLLTRLEALNALPYEYHILELSGSLKARQQQWIQEQVPHLFQRVRWLSSWPTTPFDGVILANEVLDAMPVERFLKTKEALSLSYVDLNEQQELVETYQPCLDEHLIQRIQEKLPEHAYPYQSEINLFVTGWIEQCFNMLGKGMVLLLDYGFPQHEYYHPDRSHGTLMCHYHHRAHTNPLIYVGEQDITAHVDFTEVAHAAVDAGFHVAGYTNQAAFLLSNGILEDLSAMPEEGSRLKAQQAVKTLLQPSEMGELFKVIALTKAIDCALQGFLLQDKRFSL